MAKAHFDWDSDKDLENQAKHRVTFSRAQYAFADPQRVIAMDKAHSQTEERFYCFGAKKRRSMNAKIKYTGEPLGKVKVVPDFLPSPAELAFREEGVKVTLALSKKSIEFFKSEASKHHTQYQRMIRRLIDAYVDAQAPTVAPNAPTAARR